MIDSAIRDRRLLSFTYDGHFRVVIPVAHGTHISTGNEVLRAYQIRGTSSSRIPPLWDLFRVEKIVNLEVLDETFVDDPLGYACGDKHIQIVSQL